MGKGAYGEDAGRSSSRALLWAPHVCVRVCPGRLVVGLRLRARSPIPFPLPRAFFSAGTLVVGALASGAVRPPRVRSGVWVCVLWGRGASLWCGLFSGVRSSCVQVCSVVPVGSLGTGGACLGGGAYCVGAELVLCVCAFWVLCVHKGVWGWFSSVWH